MLIFIYGYLTAWNVYTEGYNSTGDKCWYPATTGGMGAPWLRHWPWPRPLFEKFLRGHIRNVPVNMRVKFEIRSFNHFGAISI